MSARLGVLLVNLGTPDAPRPPEVRRYLREFLSDPRVLDINPVTRWLLLNLVILPLRPQRSARAYTKVWSEQGSPLLVHGRSLRAALAERLPTLPVVLAMRYGTPSIAAALDQLRADGCDHVVVLPLFPQYASSSTGSAVEAVYREAGRRWNTPMITVVPPFFDDLRFVEAFAQVGQPVLDELRPDHVLMSFHGLPERHMHKSDESGGHCLRSDDCCRKITDANRNCYRAQCFATARALAGRLGLSEGDWSVAFQSRLGRDPWIKPYTDERLVELARGGTKRLAVFCPAFVADCLETLEEIGMRADEDFRAAGGERLMLVPSLNAHPTWVDAVAGMIEEALPHGVRRRLAAEREAARE
ncbi:ferrochelatase [Paraliomyxa miuraensis]|uniref:ferrochelatase n=1 Tax=Paraliomyxa miuraensis TaxID=376150 RepID=UPI002253001C|nr:ferrochelatase [Paraliomyxa miuraensis]MCX4243409.1 ferrochelatase [Paraliomyxa miuraensis]